jgi:hypothetical protein
MISSRKRIAAILAIGLGILMLAPALALPVKAADRSDRLLYDTGSANTAAYVFHVENPGYFTLQDDYLNMTVYSEPIVVGTGTETNWYVQVWIYDGTTNHSVANKTLAVKHSYNVYGNISVANPGLIWTENGTAKMSVRLTSTTVHDQDVSEISIYKTQVGGIVTNMIPVIIMMGLIVMVVKMFSKSTKGVSKGKK